MKNTGFLASFILGGTIHVVILCEGCLKEKKYDF